MKLEPACLFSSLSDICHSDDDHPHHESCNTYPHPHTHQDKLVSFSASGQLYTTNQGTRCPQIKSNHEVNGIRRHVKNDQPHSNAQNHYIFNNVNYSSKRCCRSLSLPIILILVLSMPSIIYPVSGMQKGAALQKQEQLQQKDQLVEMEEDGESCRLEDSIPGTPGDDYPTYTDIPDTAFKCSDKQFPGYYADVEAQCQVFHVCQADGRKDSFLCPVGTIFNQELFVCDWWNNFRCQDAATFSDLNSELYITPKSQPNSNLLQKRTNKYELENNSVASDEREREDSIEEDDEREFFEERVTVTAAPLQARKGLFSQNLQTNSQLQQREFKGRIEDLKGRQVDRQQDEKSSPQRQEVKGKLQQEVKGRLQEVKGNLKQESAKVRESKGNLQVGKTSTTYGTRLSGKVKSSLTASRTPIENTSDDWDDDVGTTEALTTTTQATTAASWTFKPTPTSARVVSAQVKQSKQELKSPAQLKNSVKYERLVGDGKEEFVYWDSRFDDRRQNRSQFQQQMLERQRQVPVQQQQVQNLPTTQRQQLPQQIKSSRLEVEDRWTPMITADFNAPLIQTTTSTTTARSITPSITTTTRSLPTTTITSATKAPTAARLIGKKGGRVKAKTIKIQTTTVAPVTESDRQQLSERFVYWDSRFGDQQLTQQEQAELEQEQQADQKAKFQQKQNRDGRNLKRKEETSQKSGKFQQSSELRSAFEDEWDAISKEAEKMKETLSSTPPTSTRTARTTTPRSSTTRVTASVTAAPLLQSRKGNVKSTSEKQIKKSEPLRVLEADFDDQPMSAVCDWWHSPDCRDSSSSSSSSNEKENLKNEKQGYVAPMQIVSYRTSVNHDDRPSKLTSTTTSWETEEERDEREREGDSLSLDDPSEPEERVSVTLSPLTNSKKSERLKQQQRPTAKTRVQEQSGKIKKQSPAGERRKVVSNFGGRIVTKAQTKSQKKQKQQSLEDGTSSSRRQTKVTIGPAIVTTSSVPGESEAYTIFRTLKPRATSPNAPTAATASSSSTSSVTISIRV